MRRMLQRFHPARAICRIDLPSRASTEPGLWRLTSALIAGVCRHVKVETVQDDVPGAFLSSLQPLKAPAPHSFERTLLKLGCLMFLDQSFVSGSRPGHKRKWVCLPLDEGSREDADKTPSGGPAHSETAVDAPDPASSNRTPRNSTAHDGSLSKCSPPTLLFLARWLCCLP